MNWANGLRFEIVEDKFRKSPNKEIKLPRRASKGSMAYDFFSPGDFSLYPNETCMIWTDIKARMPEGVGLMLNVRSSMGKSRIGLANTQGWIDSDFYNNPDNGGNIGIFLVNNGWKEYRIAEGDRIAQGLFVPVILTDDDAVAGERHGGFGSTGK